jgi:hypothetical protein
VNDLREQDVEDLLGRDAVAPNQMLPAKNFAAKTVLVTGAAGSTGSELCRQALQLRPTHRAKGVQSPHHPSVLEKSADTPTLNGWLPRHWAIAI